MLSRLPSSYYCYSTPTFQGDLLSLISYHAWNTDMYRCEQWCLFVPELTSITFAWPVNQNHAFPVMTCNQLFSLWQVCLYFNTKANSHMTFGLLSLNILIRRCQICSLEWTHLLGRNIHLSFRIKTESWRLILTYFNLHTHKYSRADLESIRHSFFRALTELIPKVQLKSQRWEMHERSFITAVPPTVCWSLQK